MPADMARTKEMIFCGPNSASVLFPSELSGTERVLICAKLLGVWLQADIGMKKHVDCIMNIL